MARDSKAERASRLSVGSENARLYARLSGAGHSVAVGFRPDTREFRAEEHQLR